jgi:hypothetical protein
MEKDATVFQYDEVYDDIASKRGDAAAKAEIEKKDRKVRAAVFFCSSQLL